MAATAATPSAMHSTKTVSPPAPARSSRSAMAKRERQRSARAGAGVASRRAVTTRAARRLARRARHPAIGEAHDAVAALGERPVMGDEQQASRRSRSFSANRRSMTSRAGGLVEIAGSARRRG